MLVPLGVLALGAIELAILSPLLERMLAHEASELYDLADVTPIALVVIIFSLAILVAARALSRIAGGIRLRGSAIASRAADSMPSITRIAPDQVTILAGSAALPQPAIARALENAARRDSQYDARRTVAAALRGGSVREGPLNERSRAAAPGRSEASPITGARIATPARSTLPRASRAAARRDL